MAPYLTDWRGMWTGRACAVVFPTSTEEVSAILRWANAHHVPVTPQGGNTGLSGGSVPDESGTGIVLSLVKMDQVRSLNVENLSLTVEAGCVLETIQGVADQAGCLFPLSLAAEGSCTIGGNLATNAGGVGVLRYGVARDLCLGLEVVTPSGEVWDGLRGLRKDNTGYDLRDLFIGSEGTLGVITAAVLKLFPKPHGHFTAMVGLPGIAEAVSLLSRLQGALGPCVTAFELISGQCLDIVLRHRPQLRPPLAAAHPWVALVECSLTVAADAAVDQLQELLMAMVETGEVEDVAVASSIAQRRDLWALREGISEAQGSEGFVIKHDISLRVSDIADFVDQASAALAASQPGIRLGVFGHLGDGNLHFNVLGPEGEDGEVFRTRQDQVNRLVHDLVVEHGGSISAEHGLGVLRRDEAARYKSAVEMRLMSALKKAIDPCGLMNPGKLLAEDAWR
jgi:FAD/FMN-containing dehydrogenase